MVDSIWSNVQYYYYDNEYGFKVTCNNKNLWFDCMWGSFWLRLEDELNGYGVNWGKPSFWSDTCHELIHKRIGQWLIANNLAPWLKSQPTKLIVEHVSKNHFYLRKISK